MVSICGYAYIFTDPAPSLSCCYTVNSDSNLVS